MATIVDLGKQVKAKYPGQYDDLSDEELGAKVKAKYPGSYDDFSDRTVAVNGHARKRPDQSYRKREKPGLGATIGGAIGGSLAKAPGALGGPAGAYAAGVGGAAAGGAAGEAVQQTIENPIGGQTFGPMPLLALSTLNPQMIGQAAKEQAISEGAGRLLGKGVGAVAKPLMAAAIRPARAIRMAFRDVAKTALDEGVLMKKAGFLGMGKGKIAGGVATAEAARQASSAAEDALLQEAAQQGVVFDIPGLSQPMLDVAQQRLGRPLTGAEAQRVMAEVKAVVDAAFRKNTNGALQRAPWSFGPEDVKMIKQYAQGAKAGAYNQRVQGVVRAGNPDIEMAVAKSAKNLLEGIQVPSARGGSIGENLVGQMAKTQDLIGMSRAVRGRILGGEDAGGVLARHGLRGAGITLGATLGAAQGGSPVERAEHALVGAGLGGAATSPALLSLLAHAANNPAILQLIKQLPRGAVQLSNQ